MVVTATEKEHPFRQYLAFSETDALVYRRPRYYDPTPGRFLQLDDYEGNARDPQSLHKYLYCNADPVNNIDPSGQSAILSLLSFSCSWVAAGADLALPVGFGGLLRLLEVGQGHPNDAPYSTYQARLRYITNFIGQMKMAGDDYSRGSFPALDRLYSTHGFHLATIRPARMCPPENALPAKWDVLSRHMGYMITNFDEIGPDEVSVSRWATFGGAGLNMSFIPGLTVNHAQFWSADVETSIRIYLHEGFHCIGGGTWYTGIGHGAHGGIVDQSEGNDALEHYWGFVRYVIDANGRPLRSFIAARARASSPPPPAP